LDIGHHGHVIDPFLRVEALRTTIALFVGAFQPQSTHWLLAVIAFLIR
jgi:hypothetical protein